MTAPVVLITGRICALLEDWLFSKWNRKFYWWQGWMNWSWFNFIWVLKKMDEEAVPLLAPQGAEPEQPKPEPAPRTRVLSLDLLRGLTMVKKFGIISVIANWGGDDPRGQSRILQRWRHHMATSREHVEWIATFRLCVSFFLVYCWQAICNLQL